MSKPKQIRKKAESSRPRQGVPPLSPFTSERVLRDMHRAIGEREFESMDEAKAFFRTLEGPGLNEALKGAPAPSSREEAQELAYAAMEATDRADALALARQALAKDPDCVDAPAVLAAATAHSADDFIAGLEEAVSAGERVLGKKYFEENRGHFWGLIETRPYIRARRDLADALLRVGRKTEAMGHFEAILELNPSDNQGVRYTLLGCYLEGADLDRARRLLRRYDEPSTAVFNWGRTLERFLSGDLPSAEKALREARIQNRFVERYLVGGKRVPPRPPGSYILGSEDEALVCLRTLVGAWAKHPEALVWLHGAVSRNRMTF